MQLAPTSLNCFNLYDERGLIWSFFPEGVDEDDTKQLCKRWLDTLRENIPTGPYSPGIICIVHQGYMAKRGLLNTAFRRRWFVLNSHFKVRLLLILRFCLDV